LRAVLRHRTIATREALLPDHLPVLSFKSLRGDGKTTMPYIEAAGARLHVEEHGDGYWPVEAAHHPLIAYQAAFGTDLILQVAACLRFTWPRVREAIGGLSNRCWA
jgi:hypothetical protein